MKKTTVANLYETPEGPNTAYIGRAVNGKDGYFANPFTVKEHGQIESILKYQEHFLNRIMNDPEFRKRVDELRGKILLCYCAPKACHGDVIAAWLNYQNISIDVPF